MFNSSAHNGKIMKKKRRGNRILRHRHMKRIRNGSYRELNIIYTNKLRRWKRGYKYIYISKIHMSRRTRITT